MDDSLTTPSVVHITTTLHSLERNDTTPPENAEATTVESTSYVGVTPATAINVSRDDDDDRLEGESTGNEGHIFFEEDDEVSQVLRLLNFKEDVPFLSSNNLNTQLLREEQDESRFDPTEDSVHDGEDKRISRLLDKLEHNMASEKEEELLVLRGELETEQKERMDLEEKISKLVEFITFVHGEVGKLLQCFIDMSSKSLLACNMLNLGPFENEQEMLDFLETMKTLSGQFLYEFENLLETKDLLEKLNLILTRVATLAKDTNDVQEDIEVSDVQEDDETEEDVDYDQVINNTGSNDGQNDHADRISVSSMTTVMLDSDIRNITGDPPCQLLSKVRRLPRARSGIGAKRRPHGVDHSKRHMGYYCLCGTKFTQKGTLTIHVKHFTSDFKLSCSLCDKKFLYAAYLRHHMSQKHNIVDLASSGTITCSRCGTQLENRKAFSMHVRRAHGWVKFGQTRNGLGTRVVSTRGGRGRYRGSGRGRTHKMKRVAVQENLEEKTKEQHGVDRRSVLNRCLCGNVYSQRCGLWGHICAKNQGKVFGCPLCPKKFAYHSNVKLHVRRHHKVEYQEGKYGCRHCGKTFENVMDVRNHRRTSHTKAKNKPQNSPQEMLARSARIPINSPTADVILPGEISYDEYDDVHELTYNYLPESGMVNSPSVSVPSYPSSAIRKSTSTAGLLAAVVESDIIYLD